MYWIDFVIGTLAIGTLGMWLITHFDRPKT
jgi:hypothetical protein